MERPVYSGMCPYIQVYDMPASLRFYRDILGFMVLQSSGEGDDVDWVQLQLGDSELMLNTIYERDSRPAVPDASRTAAHQDTAFFFVCKDTDGLYAYLLSCGLEVKEPFVTGYGFKAVTVRDPDGYGLWFHWPVGG